MRNVADSLVKQISLAALFAFVTASQVSAQLPATRLSAVFPPGAKVGSTIDVTVTSGVELEEISKLLFTHPGITAVQKMHTVDGKPAPVPNTFVVTIAPNVPAGQYEARAVGFFGISNPRFFAVGTQSEINETEPNNVREQANAVEINQTVNGRVNGAADVDWFKFTGKAGQRLLVNCTARRLDSKLDAALELYNTSGKRLDFVRRNLSSHDAMLDVAVPADGEYFVRLYDFTYAGGEDYPYRLSFTTAPYIDFVLPISGIPDSNAQYTLYGRNLPGGKPAGISIHNRPLEKLTVNIAMPAAIDVLDPKVELNPSFAAIDATPYSINSPNGPSNVVMLQLGKFVPVLEAEPNDRGPQAQRVIVPIEIDGQFQTRGDVDCFQFEANAKETYWIEVIANRSGASIDPVLVIDGVKTNDKGEETLTRISALDDDPTNPLANLFDTLNDDNTVKFVAPADGTYRITLRERYGNSKLDLGVYRLIVRKESPDFRVAAIPTPPIAPGPRQAAPSGINLRRGDNFPVNVVAFRRDGFAGPITVSAQGLPKGVTCREINIGTNPSSGVLVFTAAEDAPAWAGMVQLIAKAKIDDPAAVEVLTAAEAAAKAASDALAAADKALLKPTESVTKANEALNGAKAELAAKPEDPALKQKVVDMEAAANAATAALKPLNDARVAAEKKVKESKDAVQVAKAAKDAAVHEVSHPARYGTVVWGAAQPNNPAESRIAQSIELSVMDELAPYQLSTDVYQVDANHSRQILVPVKVARRNGFDQPVNLTVAGQPPNAQVENKPIPKEKTEEVYRLFIPPNSPVGTYVVYLTGQAPVSYRKNVARADRAKAEFDVADKAAAATTEALKNATALKDAAAKKLEDDTANLKKLTEAKQNSEKALTDAQNAEKAAAEAVKAAGDNADAKAATEKQLAAARTVTTDLTNAFVAAEKARSEAEVAVKLAENAKVKTESDVKSAEDKNKVMTAVKTAAEAKFKAADGYAKAANINFFPTTTPIIINVKPAPCTVTASPGDGGAIKIGGKVEIKCEVKRQNGFAGPVTVTLPLPPNVAGISAQPLTIPADQSSGTLVVMAAADAPEAQLANMVVRATSDWDGEAIVDQPVTLKTVK